MMYLCCNRFKGSGLLVGWKWLGNGSCNVGGVIDVIIIV